MTTKTNTQAAYEKWLGARADDPSLPHGLMRDAFCAGVEADRQGRMPSDEEIIASVVAYGEACASLITATEREMRLHDIRALLSRYSSGQPSASAEHQQLREFYDVLTDDELIVAQQHHIEKLQATLPGRAPFPVRVREG